MRLWPLWLGAASLSAAIAGGVGFYIGDLWAFHESQKPHERLLLPFDPLAQPDAVGPVRVQFSCPQRAGREPVIVRVYYSGHPNEAGRPYANEIFEILLDPAYASGRQEEIITVPAKAVDHRVRALVDRSFGADVFVKGPGRLSGSRYVLPGDDIPDVINVECSSW